MKKLLLVMLGALAVTGMAKADDVQEDMATFRTWAMTPPMGWNSWDCYYSSVTESEVLQNAQYLVDNDLVRHGWEYVVVDIRWYCNHPSLGGGNYNQRGDQDYVLDEYGRYLPSPTRFPSAMVDGRNEGFKALAKRLHDMGLKFGIHIMRGVPKSVVGSSYKLKGRESTAWSEVYNGTTSPCTWLKDNLLVRNNEAGQLYYNSIMDLYAEWGVDFIKVDDLSRPFYTDEIHMIRKAIDQTGRPIVLSLSPGKTQYQYAQECLGNANMWRMMDDLWDNWSHVDAVFNEAHEWSKYAQPGNYADCDMLPLGQISMTIADPGYTNADAGRWTNLSQDEQLTMMTLWGICHSPLFFGGEMTKNDAFTLSLLNNEEYHQMHKYGQDAHQVMNNEDNGRVAWTSHIGDTRFLALFQRDNTRWIVGQKALYKSETIAYTTDGHAVDVDIEWPEGEKTLVLVVDDGGDNYNYDHGDWINPTLVLRDGTEVPLTGTYKTRGYTKSYFNRIYENKNVDNGGKMKVLGTEYDRGFSTDANAAIFFKIPDNMDVVRFKAKAAADDSGIGQTNATTSLRFMVFATNPLADEQDDAAARSGLISRTGTKSKTLEADITGAEQLKIVVGDAGDGFAYDRADLVNPVLIDKDGNETSLTTLTYSSYSSSWGSLHINKNVENGTLKVAGRTYTTGLGMNAQCTLVYNLPSGHQWTKFRALCGYDSSCDNDNPSTDGTTMEFAVYATKSEVFDFDLTQLGYGADEKVPVYDVWKKRSLGTLSGKISAYVPSHGVKLYRLGKSTVPGSDDPQTEKNVRRGPTMGWSSWNTYYVNISDALIRSQADAMVAKGLFEAGYDHINIDDGFFGGRNTTTGELIIHPTRFPNGLKPVADYIHSKGLKAGIYSDAGANTCGNMYNGDDLSVNVGFYNYDQRDADFYFNECGFDFIKVDFCGGDAPQNKQHLALDPQERYTAISQAIENTGRSDVRLNVCRWDYPGTWVKDIAFSWRTTHDIYDGWASVKGILAENLYMSAYGYDGHFNDMDMLEVGRSMTTEEDKTHFGMWCIMNSPLLIGCDMTSIKTTPLKLLCNEELIALNQDTLFQQAYVAALTNDCYVMVKDIETIGGKKRAFAIYNSTDASKTATVKFADIDLGGTVKLRDVFDKTEVGEFTGQYQVTVPAHGTRIYVATAEQRLERTRYEAETAYISDYQELKNNQSEKTGIYEYATYCSAGLKAGWLGCSEENDLVWRDVYSDEGGTYQLTIGYICGANRQLNVSVNGGTATKLTCNSGAWNVAGTKTITIELQKGRNRIRLSNPNDWMPDIDYIQLKKKSTPTGIKATEANAKTNGQAYDLSGRKVNAANVHHGVIIENGKKVMYK